MAMHAKGKMKKKGMARGGMKMKKKGMARGGAKMPMARDPKTGKFTLEKVPVYHIVDEKEKKQAS